MAKPSTELNGGFIFASLAFAEERESAFKFSGSRRGVCELAHEGQQLP